jgi:hypothetical protein
MFETIAFDATNSTFSTGSSGSFSLTVGANNNRIVIVTLTANNSSPSFTALTFAGQNSTLAVVRQSNSQTVQISYFLNPPTGANTLSYTLSASQNHQVTATSFYNVLQVNPVSATRDVGVASGAYTGAISVPENGLFIDAISPDAQAVISPNTGQTLIARANGGYGSMGASYRIFTTADPSYVASWDNSTFQNTTVYAEAVFKPSIRQGGSFLFNLL